MKIYPAIDLMNGRVVRLSQGSFEAVTDYNRKPAEVAKSFAASGAECLHMVDLDGAREGRVQQGESIREIVGATLLSVQVGGGIRSYEQAKAYLDAGAARVVVGSLAVREPEAMDKLLETLGPDRITLAVDFKRDPEGMTMVAWQGWKESGTTRVEEMIERFANRGLQYVLATDVGRDGTMTGPDVALYQGWQERFSKVEIQVSGGVGSMEHLRALSRSGARAAILGKALYEGTVRLEEALLC